MRKELTLKPGRFRAKLLAKVAPQGTLQLPQARERGSQICCSSSGNSRQHVFRSAVPVLMADTNLGMSERNDTMTALRSVVAVRNSNWTENNANRPMTGSGRQSQGGVRRI